MKPWPHLYLAGRILDVALTAFIITHGGQELNPIWIHVYRHGWAYALGLQLILAAPIAALARRLPMAWLAFITASWLPVAWNLTQL